jgi:hypothetical protein
MMMIILAITGFKIHLQIYELKLLWFCPMTFIILSYEVLYITRIMGFLAQGDITPTVSFMSEAFLLRGKCDFEK